MSNIARIGVTVAGFAVLVAATCTFHVKETELGIKLFLGEVNDRKYESGLHFKLPLLERVYKFDSRIMSLDAQPELVLTSEKKNVVVDSFVKWRIDDAEKYYRSAGGDERRAAQLLAQFVKKTTLDAFGKRTVQEVVSGERLALMEEVRQQTDINARDLGIAIIDVRVKKVELPADVSDSVFSRMSKERATVARAFRSRGEEKAKGIRADADRQREEILAGAYAESEAIRGEGDAEAAGIYAKAFGKDPEFYSFTRSLDAYKKSFRGDGDVMVLDPDTPFFKFFYEGGRGN
ncbi:MAG: protease modulator HflC [Granulosicoccaceae bacterium]